jgi:chromate transporter
MSAMVEGARQPAQVSLVALFAAFLQVSLCGFGGGLVWVRRMVVDKQRWLDERDFADILSLCQFLPGPNVASITVCVGSRLRGPTGAAAALAGFIVVPWSIGFSLGVLLLEYAQHPLIRNILAGVSAAAAGLMIGTGVRLLWTHRTRPLGLGFATVAFVGLVFVKVPLLVLVAVLAPLSIAAIWIERLATR